MPATIAGAVKAAVESAGLGLACYRDGAPSKPGPDGKPQVTVPLPYVTVRERIAASNDRDGVHDDGIAHRETETVQVDLWQTWRDLRTGKPLEDYTLARDLRRALRTVDLTGLPFRVYGSSIASTARLLEPVANVVHDVLTLTVRREV